MMDSREAAEPAEASTSDNRLDSAQFDLGRHASAVREANERAVLTTLRRLGEVSKADIAQQIKLTQNTVGQIVARLEARGLVTATRKRLGQRGQPATLLTLDPEGAYSIGLELGRRSLRSVLIDFTGRILHARSRELVHPMPDEAIEVLRADVAALRRALPPARRARLIGVGLALPYNLGSWRRELQIPDAVCAAWNACDILGELGAGLDLRIFPENDGTAAAAGELFHGHGRTLEDFALVRIGTAVGGGLVLGGNYRRGHSGNAADIGLMPVTDTRSPGSGGRQTFGDILLNRASAQALIRHLKANGVNIDRLSQLDGVLYFRPDLVDSWLDDCVDALMVPLFTISSLLDLEAIVIGGTVPRALLERMISKLATMMSRHAPEARKPPVLLLGELGPDAAARGAATLPFYAAYASDHEFVCPDPGSPDDTGIRTPS